MRRTSTSQKERLPELARERPLEAFGVALLVAACVVSVVTWVGIRDVNNPAAQFPVITSGGLAAIGLFMVGSNLLLAGIIVRHFTEQERSTKVPMAWYTGTEEDEAVRPMPDHVARRRERVAKRTRPSHEGS